MFQDGKPGGGDGGEATHPMTRCRRAKVLASSKAMMEMVRASSSLATMRRLGRWPNPDGAMQEGECAGAMIAVARVSSRKTTMASPRKGAMAAARKLAMALPRATMVSSRKAVSRAVLGNWQ